MGTFAALTAAWMTWQATATTAAGATWLLDEQLRVQVRPPLPVGWVDSHLVSRWLVSWTPGDPTFTANLCSIVADPVMGARTTWPEAARRSVPPLTRPVTFDGATFAGGPVVETIGDGDDDGDGNPGISIGVAHPRVGAGEVFIRQVTRVAWTGQMRPDGVIAGTMVYEPEQELLGATTWWLRMGLAQRTDRKEPSTFTLSPLPDGAGCP